ncbi:LysR substrate-binding domain-containing protein [Fuscibacter oryzae]|uniref:LysR family transcriptional regulator n=1 Tax=Fuscibacter oryzae TaxID=2803939 RepID=A0A8J7STP1_9RHOB|nr:LysR substrate-binding domain-containing protein [Fuscibacter oryzae]MBL4929406.1 LysR family transcriptional regulator [Fuscibacter oryzae]
MTARVRLPPLNLLRVFHAVSRHRSLREAAEELLVSPQDVGQQIRLLEEALGVVLFEQGGRGIRLTKSAITLSHYVNAGFESFDVGVSRIINPRERVRITLNVSPYFGTHYLLPRLGLFRQIVPDAEIELTSVVDIVDMEREQIDLAVQWGYGDRMDVVSHLLLRDPKVICCHPNMAERIDSPEDLLRFSLLQPLRSKRLWPDILKYLGVKARELDGALTLDDAETMRLATQEGLGVGLISVLEAEEDIRLGRLAAPLGVRVLAGMPAETVPGFYLITTKAKQRSKHIAAVHRWLQRQDWENITPA